MSQKSRVKLKPGGAPGASSGPMVAQKITPSQEGEPSRASLQKDPSLKPQPPLQSSKKQKRGDEKEPTSVVSVVDEMEKANGELRATIDSLQRRAIETDRQLDQSREEIRQLRKLLTEAETLLYAKSENSAKEKPSPALLHSQQKPAEKKAGDDDVVMQVNHVDPKKVSPESKEEKQKSLSSRKSPKERKEEKKRTVVIRGLDKPKTWKSGVETQEIRTMITECIKAQGLVDFQESLVERAVAYSTHDPKAATFVVTLRVGSEEVAKELVKRSREEVRKRRDGAGRGPISKIRIYEDLPPKERKKRSRWSKVAMDRPPPGVLDTRKPGVVDAFVGRERGVAGDRPDDWMMALLRGVKHLSECLERAPPDGMRRGWNNTQNSARDGRPRRPARK